MAFNVWFIIWPNQQKVIGLVEASAEEKPKAARAAALASRTNTMLDTDALRHGIGPKSILNQSEKLENGVLGLVFFLSSQIVGQAFASKRRTG